MALLALFDRFVVGLVAIVRLVCIVLATALFVIVIAAIVARYGFGRAVSWTEEVPRYLLIWVSFLGAAVCVLKREHVGFELLFDSLPPRAISVPAKTKKMTASSGKVLIAVNMRWTIVALSTPGSSRVANTVDTPTANEIGIPSAVRMMKARPRRMRTMAQSTLVPVIAAASGRTISSTISLKANTMIRKPEIGIAG